MGAWPKNFTSTVKERTKLKGGTKTRLKRVTSLENIQ
jgi:hypothetical protein